MTRESMFSRPRAQPRVKRTTRVWSSLALAALLGCSAAPTNTEPTEIPPTPLTFRTPVLTGVTPPTAEASGLETALVLAGTQFDEGAIVLFGGRPLTPSTASTTELSVAIPGEWLAEPGLWALVVVNPGVTGGRSDALSFEVTARQAAPVLFALVPAEAPTGASEATVEVHGSNFVPASVVLRDGEARATEYVSSGLLRVALTSADLASNGQSTLTVRTPPARDSEGLAFTVKEVELRTAGVLVRVTSAPDGTSANDDSYASTLSRTGRYVAFTSRASNLVPNDTNGREDVFVRDTCLGAPVGCVPATVIASVATDGTVRFSDSRSPSLSADGRYVAFRSGGVLVEGATNWAVYIRDTCFGASGGCVPTTLLMTITDGGVGVDGESPSLSASGRYVAFVSDDPGLVEGDTNNDDDVFVRDTCLGAASGCVPSVRRVSVGAGGVQANERSGEPAISPDGRFVSFGSFDSAMLPGNVTQEWQILLADSCFGAPAGCVPSVRRISVGVDGNEASTGCNDDPAPVSEGGRFVAFVCDADGLVAGDTNAVADIFVRDTCLGADATCVPTTRLESQAPGGLPATDESWSPSLSADGRMVGFLSKASNLASDPTYSGTQAFARDTCAGQSGCTPKTTLVSRRLEGAAVTNWRPDNGIGLSGDGHSLSFTTNARNLVDEDTNSMRDVFVASTGL